LGFLILKGNSNWARPLQNLIQQPHFRSAGAG
jgi:hypothetical protein